MPTLQERISDKFIETLLASDAVTKTQVESLRVLLSSRKKIKPDDLVAVLTSAADTKVK